MGSHKDDACPMIGYYMMAEWAAGNPEALLEYAAIWKDLKADDRSERIAEWAKKWPMAWQSLNAPAIVAGQHAVIDACHDDVRMQELRAELNALKGDQAAHEKKAIFAIADETKRHLKRTAIECEPLEVVGGLLTLLVGVALQHGVSRESCIRIVGDAYNINKQLRDRARTAPDN